MTQVTVIEKPSEQIIAKANAEYKVTDEQGRVLTLKRPGILAQYRLVEAIGESAKNTVYMNMVMPLLYVAAIDDMPVRALIKKSEIEALLQRLNDEGVKAVARGIEDYFITPDQETEAKDSLKK